jgi:nitrate/TMAO reductase-like tetraheme cytochrome c subunit
MNEIMLALIGSIAMIACWGAIIMNYERQKVKQANKEKGLYETCVSCSEMVHVRKDIPIDQRFNYVEGAGQMCHDCYEYVYRDK